MIRPGRSWLAFGLALLVSCSGATNDRAARAEYASSVEKIRADREQRLRKEDGWLSLVGLYWLEVGENSFGSDPSSAVPLIADGVPPRAGSLLYDGRSVRVRVAPGAPVTLDGRPVTESVLRDDTEEGTDVLELARLRFYVIRRGDRRGIRVKDPQSPARTEFHGLDYFPTDPGYRLSATFVPYDEPREIRIANVLGTVEVEHAPGYIEFSLNGESHTLVPLGEPDDRELFIIFKDRTSGRESYGAGRFLEAERDGDRVELDFNLAYNPPCAFTEFATCPLPPRENWLEVPIRAGEKAYGHH